MTFFEYQQHVLRTESRDPELEGHSHHRRMLHAAIGLCTEAGEALDAVKKTLFYASPLNIVNLCEELGDIAWYWALACDALNLDPGDVLAANVRKLRARYPERFDSECAETRNIVAEVAAMMDGAKE
jgi:NTP pyrophosphatase (non-canonical NTP hydrolase)